MKDNHINWDAMTDEDYMKLEQLLEPTSTSSYINELSKVFAPSEERRHGEKKEAATE